MGVENLSLVNAILNGLSTIMLIMGFIKIKVGKKIAHKNYMVIALIISFFFLISYLVYHYHVGSVPYPYHDWTRPVYFGILILHVIFAGINAPFILALVYFAIKGNFINHKKLAHWVWPVWMYVSITGVVIYLMNYVF